MKIQNFNCWYVIFWMKIQNSAWFQYKTFPCYEFSFLRISYIDARRTLFFMLRQYLFFQRTRAYICVVTKTNELKIHIFLTICFYIRNKKIGCSLKQFNTRNHFGKLISFSVKSHILTNAASLARRWIGFPSGNTTSLYLDKIFFVFKFSTDPLIN